ncbi:PTS sugar transporter subunit IIA [Corynebacterium sp. CCM 9185]|uniref:Ascorbate-specific PTS system EIIA component n=1 Tax=Corynebacterium marambiense TaxID=2765364 RepID=A0ABS0VVC9_9CORY|nr:PTS sugar transporter subunit IIA [Corynebacterium marambiense]MBI9000730.1 PTS sugar transporter subunit IIA [Corynebacterium marambiense]MCK7663007.1 PTS sugar transporter subunit IIA [Corynebacterium marambiense]MCX7542621.1 PTS sugar transporter subunit IIA [Corynebacterium marambiense]
MDALHDLLTRDRIAVGVPARDWREAIRRAGELLVSTDATDAGYTDEMIGTVEENGPYIVIAPGVAFAHARPSRSVHRTALSLIVLTDPVSFGHPSNDPVDIVVALSATDPDTHVKAMKVLARGLGSEELRAALREAATADEVIELIDRATTRTRITRDTSPTPRDTPAPSGADETVPSKGLILTVCGNGLGTSLFLKNTLEDVLDEWGWSRYMTVEATDTISAKGKSGDADCILTSGEIARALGDLGVPMRVISNFTSTDEIDAALREIYAV